MRNPYQPRPGVQPGTQLSSHIRQPEDVHVPTVEQEPGKYIALALLHIRRELARLPAMIADHSKPVDEYRPQELTPDNATTMTLQPNWETCEIIESIIITGPPGNIIVQLGDRTWQLAIPPVGYIILAPLMLILGRTDQRILTGVVSGQYTMELMGHADTRGNLI